MPTVSIVVPLYNKAPYVRRSLDSILRQRLQDFEVLVVDDGSTDDGPQQVAAYPDARIRLLRQENAGPGAARNRGIEEARAPYVAFLDADDEWLPDFLERTIAALDRHPEAATATCAYFTDPGRNSSVAMWKQRGLTDGVHRVTAESGSRFFLHLLAFLSPCTTVTRAPVLRRWGGFYTADKCRYAEDAFLWLKVLLNEAVLVDLCPAVVVHTEASGLTKNIAGPHPIEPFLEHPQEIQAVCPESLQPMLAELFAIRAYKTACWWGAWGRRDVARRLRQQFDIPGGQRLPYYWASRLFATRLGLLAGTVLRGVL